MSDRPKLIMELEYTEKVTGEQRYYDETNETLYRIVFNVDNKEIPIMHNRYDCYIQEYEEYTKVKYVLYGPIRKKFEKNYNKVGLTRDDITPEFLSKAICIEKIDFKLKNNRGDNRKWIPDGLQIKSICVINNDGWKYEFSDSEYCRCNYKLKDSEMRRKRKKERMEKHKNNEYNMQI